MKEEWSAQQNISGHQKACEPSCGRRLYKKPALQFLSISGDMIAGGSTSNQLENSAGLIGNGS